MSLIKINAHLSEMADSIGVILRENCDPDELISELGDVLEVITNAAIDVDFEKNMALRVLQCASWVIIAKNNDVSRKGFLEAIGMIYDRTDLPLSFKTH